MKPDKHAIRSLMDFLHLSARVEANKATFSQFLGLSVSKHLKNAENDDKDATIMRADQFSFLEHKSSSSTSLVFRYQFPYKNRLQYLDNNNDDDDDDNEKKQQYRGPSLSTYTSILDEVTTMGLIAASPKHPLPGVSVIMQSQWGAAHAQQHASQSSSLLEEVDIVTTITKKGRTLAFVRAEVRDPSNNDGVICYFDHVKYLPVGWMLSLLFTPIGMWCLNLYSRYILPYINTNTNTYNGGGGGGGSKSKNMDPMNNHSNIMDSFQKTSDTTATFQFSEQHANGFGGLHGGVQAIIMEYLGQSVARNELSKFHLNSHNSNSSSSSSSDLVVECERLQISYQSSASRVLEVRAHIMEPPRLDHPSITLRIEILRSNKKSQKGSRKPVVVSEGILTFTSAASLMKAKEQ
jgi:acyl-coenzyme A thioesterase PaaI-like protein